MKYLSTLFHKNLAFIFLLILTVFILPDTQVISQDAAYTNNARPFQHAYLNRPISVEAGIENLTADAVNNIRTHFRIIDLSNDEIVFEYRDTIPQLDGNSTIRVSSLPEEWIPQNTGQYLVQFYFEADNDQDPVNNQRNTELSVIDWPFPFEIIMEQIDFINPFQQVNSNSGYFTITFEPVSDAQFVNIMATVQGFSGEPIWLVQNFPLLPFESDRTVSVWVSYEDLGIEDGDELHDIIIDYQMSDEINTEAFSMQNFYPLPVETTKYNVLSENNEDKITNVPLELPEISWDLPIPITWHYRGCKVPNIDLDSSQHQPDADYAGDWNACGPASTANSMQWLEDENDNIESTGTTHREKMEEMSGMMDREDEKGVTTEQMLKGKLAYIDKHKLPIKVKFQSYFTEESSIASPNEKYGHSAENQSDSAGAPPTFDWIKQEMENDEDVEILFGWYDNSGNRHGGHWVVLTGVSDVGTAKGLYFKDDTRQDTAGGLREQYVNWIEKDEWGRLKGLDGVNNVCWVESAISESYDSTVTHDIQDLGIDIIDFTPTFEDFTSFKSTFNFTFLPEPYDRYLNVFALDTGGNRQWIIRNIFLPPFEGPSDLSVWWDLGILGYQEGEEINEVEIGYNTVTKYIDESMTEIFDISNWQPIETLLFEYDKQLNTVDEREPIKLIDPELTIDFELGREVKWHYRGCEVPNIDLDSSKYNPTTEKGYAGDANACGPAGAANSLHWLETTHPKLKENTTHREKLKELSEMMDREDNEGVSDQDFIEAKLEYIDKYKLPINVKFQGTLFGTDSIPSPNDKYGHYAVNHNDSANAFPDFDWMLNEVKEGEDVELGIVYYKADGDSIKSVGGHWVTISGVSDVGTAKGFYFKDDANQSKSGGTRQQYCNWKVHDGIPYLPQLSSDSILAVPETIVSESYDSTVNHDIKDVKIEKINYQIDPVIDENLKGLVTFDFIPDEEHRYLNLVTKDKNGDNFWLLRNVFLPPFDYESELSVWFDFSWLGYEDKDELGDLIFMDYALQINNSPVDSNIRNELVDFRSVELFDLKYDKALNILEDDTTKIDPIEIELDLITPFKEVIWHYRGCEVPNLDLDSSRYNPTTDTSYAGDKNACGPVSAANSLQWLADNDDSINDPNTHREKLKELSKMMGRNDNAGVYTKNFIEAKLEYIDKYKLPISVKYQGWKSGLDSVNSPNPNYGHSADNQNPSSGIVPNWEWIINEMKNDEDVELEYGYYDSTGTRRGGHWVTITGVSDNGNYRGIYIKDDATQSDSGGTRQQYVNLDSAHGYWYLKQISSSRYTCYVETVVSESYDPTITFDKKDDGIDIDIKPLDIMNPTGDYKVDSFFDITYRIEIPDTNDKDKWVNMYFRNPEKPENQLRIIPFIIPEYREGKNNILEEKFNFKPERVEGLAGSGNGNSKDNSTQQLDALEVAHIISDTPLDDSYEPEEWTSYPVGESYSLPLSNDALSNESLSLDGVEPSDISIKSDASTDYLEYDKPMIDLNNSQYNSTTVDGYDGDKNAGALLSAAIGMDWLESNEGSIDTELDMRNKLYVYSGLSDRENERGVYTNDLISSMLEFIDVFETPIKVEFQSFKLGADNIPSPIVNYEHEAENMTENEGDGPNWTWLKDKLDKGYDVILEYGIYDSTDQRIAGNWVNVTGYMDFETAKAIKFNYDFDHENEGKSGNYITVWEESQEHSYLSHLSTDKITSWVETVVASKYDSTVTFESTGVEELLSIDNELNVSVYRNPSDATEEIEINFIMPKSGNVNIDLIDLQGNKVHNIHEGFIKAGEANVGWNGLDSNGNRITNGVYLIVVSTAEHKSAVKIIRR